MYAIGIVRLFPALRDPHTTGGHVSRTYNFTVSASMAFIHDFAQCKMLKLLNEFHPETIHDIITIHEIMSF